MHPIYGKTRTPEDHATIDGTKALYAALLDHLNALPPNRERALAITHLEDSAMRATRAILAGAQPPRQA